MKGSKKILLLVTFVCGVTANSLSFYQMPWQQQDDSSLGLWGTITFFWWSAKQIFKLKNFLGGGSTLMYTLMPGYVLAALYVAQMGSRPKQVPSFQRPVPSGRWGRRRAAAQQEMNLQPIHLGMGLLGAYGLYALLQS
jgi:hypothetical protein